MSAIAAPAPRRDAALRSQEQIAAAVAALVVRAERLATTHNRRADDVPAHREMHRLHCDTADVLHALCGELAAVTEQRDAARVALVDAVKQP